MSANSDGRQSRRSHSGVGAGEAGSRAVDGRCPMSRGRHLATGLAGRRSAWQWQSDRPAAFDCSAAVLWRRCTLVRTGGVARVRLQSAGRRHACTRSGDASSPISRTSSCRAHSKNATADAAQWNSMCPTRSRVARCGAAMHDDRHGARVDRRCRATWRSGTWTARCRVGGGQSARFCAATACDRGSHCEYCVGSGSSSAPAVAPKRIAGDGVQPRHLRFRRSVHRQAGRVDRRGRARVGHRFARVASVADGISSNCRATYAYAEPRDHRSPDGAQRTETTAGSSDGRPASPLRASLSAAAAECGYAMTERTALSFG